MEYLLPPIPFLKNKTKQKPTNEVCNTKRSLSTSKSTDWNVAHSFDKAALMNCGLVFESSEHFFIFAVNQVLEAIAFFKDTNKVQNPLFQLYVFLLN